jgi:ribose transport system ATP-binding protein
MWGNIVADGETILIVDQITKRYGSHLVLDNVSFHLHSGEVICIVGENGAGKSTLIKILSGAVKPDSGKINIKGKTYAELHPRQSMQLGIATIYQDVELIDSLTVADNIFLGNETMNRFPFIVDANSQFEKSRRILQTLHIDIDEKALVESLSAAQKQNLQIAKAFHQDARVLIMDEPTSSLGVEEKRSLIRLIEDLKKRGLGIIYISHYLEEIFEIGDTILILKDGKQVGIYPREDVDINFVINKMVGRDAAMFFKRESVPLGEVQVKIKNISWGNIVKDVSFDVRAGEIFGIGGLVGSGRSELAACIFGMARKDNGEIIINGKAVQIQNPRDAIKNKICLITEDRKKYALFEPMNVQDNIVILNTELKSKALLNLEEEKRISRKIIDRLHIVVNNVEESVMNLSGGNQQKTVLGRWLLMDAVLFIFDEPTKGVDIGAKEEIYKLIVELAREGKSIIMISSDMPELLSMSDRIGIMRDGQLIKIMENHNISEQTLIHDFIGI